MIEAGWRLEQAGECGGDNGRIVAEHPAAPGAQDKPAVLVGGGYLQDARGLACSTAGTVPAAPGWLSVMAPRLGAAAVRNDTSYGCANSAPSSSRKTGTAGE